MSYGKACDYAAGQIWFGTGYSAHKVRQLSRCGYVSLSLLRPEGLRGLRVLDFLSGAGEKI